MSTQLINLKNFTAYTPALPDADTDEAKEEKARLESLISSGVIFLKCEDGLDWYESQKLFRDDTLKLTYDAQGIVRSISRDVTALWPVDKSVAELPDTEENREADIHGGWVCRNGCLMRRVYTAEEIRAQSEAVRQQLLKEAASAIAPLQDAVELDMATDDELSRLKAWKKYRVLVSRVDADKPVWPEKP